MNPDLLKAIRILQFSNRKPVHTGEKKLYSLDGYLIYFEVMYKGYVTEAWLKTIIQEHLRILKVFNHSFLHRLKLTVFYNRLEKETIFNDFILKIEVPLEYLST